MAEPRPGQLNGKQIIARFLRRAVVTVLIVVACVYAVDFAIVRIRMASKSSVFGTVAVRPYYAVPQKNKKTEFIFDDRRSRPACTRCFLRQAICPAGTSLGTQNSVLICSAKRAAKLRRRLLPERPLPSAS